MTPETHLANLRRPNLDGETFIQTLIEIREDVQLSEEDRQRLYLIIAMESYIWHLEAVTGHPLDRELYAQAMRDANHAKLRETPVEKEDDGDGDD